MNTVSACFDGRPQKEIEKEREKIRKKQLLNYHRKKLFSVGELIKELNKYNPSLPVCISDWNERYGEDNNDVSRTITENEGVFISKHEECFGSYIVIG